MVITADAQHGISRSMNNQVILRTICKAERDKKQREGRKFQTCVQRGEDRGKDHIRRDDFVNLHGDR